MEQKSEKMTVEVEIELNDDDLSTLKEGLKSDLWPPSQILKDFVGHELFEGHDWTYTTLSIGKVGGFRLKLPKELAVLNN